MKCNCKSPIHLKVPLSYEIVPRLIEEYKAKNILMVHGYKNAASMQFSVFNKIIPASALGKALCHACFGFYIPIDPSTEY
jgi:hypothetical protein